MELIFDKSFDTLDRTYTLKISHLDMQNAKIRQWDHALFEDCNRKDASIADRLLALEVLARRIEEGSKEEMK